MGSEMCIRDSPLHQAPFGHSDSTGNRCVHLWRRHRSSSTSAVPNGLAAPPHRSCRLKSSCSSRFAMHNPSVSMPFWTRARLPWPKSTPYQPSSASPCAMPSMPQSMPSPLARSRHAKLLAHLSQHRSPHQNQLPSRRQSQPHAQLLTHAQPMRRHAWTSTVSAHGSKTAPRPPMVQCSSPPVSQGKKPLAAASPSPAR